MTHEIGMQGNASRDEETVCLGLTIKYDFDFNM